MRGQVLTVTASATNLISCGRLNTAWLTIGATMLRRTRKMPPQTAPSMPVASIASHPCSMCPRPKATLKTITPHRAAAQILLEPMHDETALDLLANAAGNHDDQREDDGVPRRLQHGFERVQRHIVQLRAHTSISAQHDDNHDEHGRARESMPRSGLPQDRPVTEQHRARALALAPR